MIYKNKIYGNRIYLKSLDINDYSDEYLSWMNDRETNRYMETRHVQHTEKTIKKFVNDMLLSDNNYLFGIFTIQNNIHIGNIKVGPISKLYNYADISYFIGNKEYRNKGYVTEAISLIISFAKNILCLHRLQAGVIQGNEKSIQALISNGFIKEGQLKDKFIIEQKYRDHLLFGLIL